MNSPSARSTAEVVDPREVESLHRTRDLDRVLLEQPPGVRVGRAVVDQQHGEVRVGRAREDRGQAAAELTRSVLVGTITVTLGQCARGLGSRVVRCGKVG